ncbi:MAG: D-alanine--D-alanine ligase family protein [Bacillota bacterium]|jgi:D-alanine-D-alanine ligase
MQKIRLGVIYGGPSVEHEIAIISACQAMAAIDTDKYEVIPVFITKKGMWYTGEALKEVSNYAALDNLLKQCQQVFVTANRGEHKLVIPKKGLFGKEQEIAIDVMVPVMHGAHGEDGCLQGLLELLNIPYAGPGVLGAAVGMDKIMMKAVLKSADIPVIDGVYFTTEEWYAEREAKINLIEEKLGYPVIVKPANLGSSVGIGKAENRDSLAAALDYAATFTGRLLIEHCVTNMREINCSVLGGSGLAKTSVCEEPITSSEFLTYEDKYMGGGKGAKGAKGGSKGMSGSKRQIPADLPQEMSDVIRELAKRSFIALDGSGVCRVDIILDVDKKQAYVNEVNTIPGSLSFYLWEATGMNFTELMDELVNLALKRQRTKESYNFSFDTNILAGFSKGGAKGTKGVK